MAKNRMAAIPASKAEVEPELATVKQAAAYLTIHPSTVYRMVEREELPAIVITSNVFRIPWKSLREFVAQRTKAAKATAN